MLMNIEIFKKTHLVFLFFLEIMFLNMKDCLYVFLEESVSKPEDVVCF
jgi:hypothetical protein